MDYDDSYANAPYIDRAEAYPPRWQQEAANWRARLQAQDRLRAGLSYGSGKREAFDLFLPDTDTPRGLVIFVHGGYWLGFDRSVWSHFSQGPRASGWAVAMPSYDLCPEVRISQITRQIAAAVTRAAAEIDGPLVLSGHSAGGHLVARMLEPDLLPRHVATRLQRVMPISPLSDLRPLLMTSMNADLRLDATEAAAESPRLMPRRHDVPVTVWVGGDERPAFLDQARWLAEAWSSECIIDTGKHHFDVIDGLSDPSSAMVAALLR